jgi:hypothetical protein
VPSAKASGLLNSPHDACKRLAGVDVPLCGLVDGDAGVRHAVMVATCSV